MVTTPEALSIAQQRGLDLVEVAPAANPPVCRIIDYGKYKYEMLKKTQQQRKNTRATKIKGIRLSTRISDHDLEVKVENGRKFIERGDKIRVDILLRGRENLHADLAFDALKKYAQMIQTEIVFEQPPKRMGNSVIMIIRKK